MIIDHVLFTIRYLSILLFYVCIVLSVQTIVCNNTKLTLYEYSTLQYTRGCWHGSFSSHLCLHSDLIGSDGEAARTLL